MTIAKLLRREAQNQNVGRDVSTHVKAALGHLALADCRLKDRLRLASQDLDAALAEHGEWPAGLYDRACQVAAELRENRDWIGRGGGSTIRRFIESLGRQILELAIDAELASRIEPCSAPLAGEVPGAEKAAPALIPGGSRYIPPTEPVSL